MSGYPAYVQRLLQQARDEGQWYAYQPDAAALCFEVLAQFPDHPEAAELIYQLYGDEWLIYDNRVAVQMQVDEWDDRPWQQRRRLALSFRFMSRWEGWHREYEPEYEHEREGPPDVADLLAKGKAQLLHAYCLGDNECTNLAWEYFDRAARQTNKPAAALLWIGKQYADLGFLADAAEVLTELCTKFKNDDARRFLAEVRWWRDSAYRIPWLPPAGDGSLYKHMMDIIDPDAADDEALMCQLWQELDLPDPAATSLALTDELAEAVNSAVTSLDAAPTVIESVVDWSFLAEDDGQPGELPDWVKKMLARVPPGPLHDNIAHRHQWSRPIPPPPTPPHRNPDEPTFDPPEFFFDDEEDDDGFNGMEGNDPGFVVF